MGKLDTRVILASIVVILGLACLAPSAATAQGSDTTVRVPREVHEQDVSLPERPEVETIGEALEYLSILVDGRPCGTISFTDEMARNEEGDAIGRVTADDKACTKPGAIITFAGPYTPALDQTFVFEPGGEFVLTSVVPEAPSSDPPAAVTADSDSYELGDVATISAEGLESCAGETVLMGLFGPGGEPSPLYTAETTLNSQGSGSVTFEITVVGSVYFAGVEGSCLEGTLVSSNPAAIPFVDPPNPRIRAQGRPTARGLQSPLSLPGSV